MSQSPDDQLIELLLHLRRTTPEQARQVLNAQPQLSYLLIQLMVKMNAINFEALQKTLATYIPGAAQSQPAAVPVPPAAAAPSIPPSAVPRHVASSSQFRTATPPFPGVSPAAAYPPFQGNPPNQYGPLGGIPSGTLSGFQGGPPPAGFSGGSPPTSFTGAPSPTPASGPAAPGLTADALAAMPEQQRAMITRIVTMTPESIRLLPLQERDTINQIRATLGLPTG
ncbi:hypothetical protein NEOLEDRAFT_1174339 [Neolentinus lepideus HHB14362 ss-1]|uniref:Cleavage stimulation factor subunit 2 hinge domain-containing protein n=1 Tax=Neolentinus lepideus HHB14362 ss-1 TaxID=1314782 RepID=A0A165WCN8_9AGAM|nr:hypothetical protein NEOLEDRAFT_1174339 [Neolentinus lepideus HHB14362 ss-1]